MNCVTHPAVPATAYCRICGRAMCDECKRDVQGTIYCDACLAREVHAPTPGVPVGPPTGPIPGLALGLGFIPGVGAIYNGQYAKAFVHVIIFGVLVHLVNQPEVRGYEALFGMMIPAFIFYMAFEAFHTARKRALGQSVDEWSGLFASSAEIGPGQSGGMTSGARSGGAPGADRHRRDAAAQQPGVAQLGTNHEVVALAADRHRRQHVGQSFEQQRPRAARRTVICDVAVPSSDRSC